LLEAWQSRLPGLVGDFYSLPTVELLQGIVQGLAVLQVEKGNDIWNHHAAA
jgi:hypothetical protein